MDLVKKALSVLDEHMDPFEYARPHMAPRDNPRTYKPLSLIHKDKEQPLCDTCTKILQSEVKDFEAYLGHLYHDWRPPPGTPSFVPHGKDIVWRHQATLKDLLVAIIERDCRVCGSLFDAWMGTHESVLEGDIEEWMSPHDWAFSVVSVSQVSDSSFDMTVQARAGSGDIGYEPSSVLYLHLDDVIGN